MKLVINKPLLIRIIKILKWSKIIAKFTAIGTTISGAVTLLSGSATSGIALSAAGATTYAATKGLPQGYEKTKHIPPGRVNKTANMLRQQEIAMASKNQVDIKKMPTNSKMLKGTMFHTPHTVPAARAAASLGASTTMLARKK